MFCQNSGHTARSCRPNQSRPNPFNPMCRLCCWLRSHSTPATTASRRLPKTQRANKTHARSHGSRVPPPAPTSTNPASPPCTRGRSSPSPQHSLCRRPHACATAGAATGAAAATARRLASRRQAAAGAGRRGPPTARGWTGRGGARCDTCKHPALAGRWPAPPPAAARRSVAGTGAPAGTPAWQVGGKVRVALPLSPTCSHGHLCIAPLPHARSRSGGHAVTLEGRLRRFETEAAAAAVPVHQQRHGTAAAVVAADMAAGTRQNVAAWHLRRLLAQLGRAVHGPRAEALAPPLLPPTATTTAWAAAASQLKVAAAAAVDVVVRTRTHARHCLCPPCHRTRRPTGCPAPQACDGDGSGTVASALVALVEAQLVAVAAAAAAALELCQIVRPAGNSAAASTLRFAQAQLTGLQRLRLPPALQRRSALAATSVQAALEALEVPTVPGPGAAGPRVALLQAVAAAAATAAASILPATVVAGGCQLLDVTTCYRTPRMRWQHNASALAATA